MSDFLEQMARSSAQRAAAARSFGSRAFDKPVYEIEPKGFGVIAEIKERSPAEGALGGESDDRCQRAHQYRSAGAAAISVLTEPSRFDGELAHLAEIVSAVPGLPVMRKDFLVEPVQVLEARAAGASGVLLIVAMLGEGTLRSMLDCAYEHGMFVLLECFDAGDLERTTSFMSAADADKAAAGQLLFGVNTRNLRTLEVDPDRLADLASLLPPGRSVAESGLKTADDAARVAAMGYSMALVGTALMRQRNPMELLTDMRAAGEAGLAS